MQKDKKNIVLVTTWFPPLQSVAVNRMLAFSKYLDKSKYKLTVVTLESEDAKYFEVLDGSNVFRLKNKSLFNLPKFNSTDTKFKHKFKVLWKLFVLKINKDEYKNWRKNVVNKLIEINNIEKIDLIISSFAPLSPHKAVSQFLDKSPETKWIADMRDEMSKNPFLKNKTLKKRLVAVEKEVNKRASAITTVSLPIVNYFKETFIDVKIFAEIRNGYDNELKTNEMYFNRVFTILYAGSFYGSRYKPDTFFEALLNCKDALPNEWEIKFVGTSKNFNIPNEFMNNVKFIARVKQSESIKLMSEADANLLIQPFVGRKGIYTGKIFDYLSVKKPVIAVVDSKDVGADLIRKTNMGFVADFDDIKEIENAIRKTISLWKNKTVLNFNNNEIHKLHRKYQVKKMEILIEEILDEEI